MRASSSPLLPALLLAALSLASCKAEPDDFHPWGTFSTTRTRLGDTCRAVDGGCFTASNTTVVTLGVRTGSGAAVLKRTSNTEVAGIQEGARFLFEIDTSDGGVTQTVCGCPAHMRETVWGELLDVDAGPVEDAGAPEGCDGGDDFCAWWIRAPACGTDPGLSAEGWVDGGAPLDLNVQYSAFRATLVDELTLAPGSDIPDGGCACLPCRVTYQLSGSL